jgi:hypothetical protein
VICSHFSPKVPCSRPSGTVPFEHRPFRGASRVEHSIPLEYQTLGDHSLLLSVVATSPLTGRRLFAEDLGVAIPQFADGHPLDRRDLFSDIQFHALLHDSGSRKPLTNVEDIEHCNSGKLKASRRDSR